MRAPHRPAELVGRVFRGRDAVTRGLLTEKQLRSSVVHVTAADLHDPAALVARVREVLAPPRSWCGVPAPIGGREWAATPIAGVSRGGRG